MAVRTARMTVKDAYEAGADISTMLVAVRGSESVAAVSCSIDNPQHAQVVIRAAATGFSADVLLFTSDTFHTTLETSPISGKPWQRNEMNAVAEFYEGREKGWVSDAIMVVAVNRAGDVSASTLTYKMAGRRLEWTGDDFNSDEGDELGGVMARILREAMKEPTLSQSLDSNVREMLAIDHEMAMIAQDLATCQTLAGLDQRPILLAANDARASTLQKLGGDAAGFVKLLESLIDKIRSN